MPPRLSSLPGPLVVVLAALPLVLTLLLPLELVAPLVATLLLGSLLLA